MSKTSILICVGVATVIVFGVIKTASAFALPPFFCQGVREDGQRYEDFLSDPAIRISSHYRCKWKLAVWRAQMHHCGAPTFEQPVCSQR